MNDEKYNKGHAGEVLNLFGVPCSKKRRRRKSSRISDVKLVTQKLEGAISTPRPPVDYSNDPVITRLYVARNLDSFTLTGPASGLPDQSTRPVLPDDGSVGLLTMYTALTRELYREIREQLDKKTARELGWDKAAVILARWDVIDDFARESGWDREEGSKAYGG